jgi:hypothetical protein
LISCAHTTISVLTPHHLIATTLDNAAYNDVLIRTLSQLLIEKFDIQYVPENGQVRCLAHVVNLVVQKILALLEEADDPDIVDYYASNKDQPIHYDPEDDEDLQALENEVDVEDEGELEEEEDADESFMRELLMDSSKKLSALQKVSET